MLAIPLSLLVAQVNAVPCPCNVFGTPTGQNPFVQSGGIEVGFKFRSDISGFATGVRFYKQGIMGGTHTGNLWTTGGVNLATATFSGETSSGWQEVMFGTPVAVTAGTNYVASVTMADGNYIATSNYFTSNIVNSPLTAPSSGSSGGNGVFSTTPGQFPGATFNSTNYWIDVAYRSNLGLTAPTITSTDPLASSTDVNPGKTVKATFDDAMDATTITTSTFTLKDASNNPITGTVSYSNTTKVASFTPTSPLTEGGVYTATIVGGTGTVAKNMEGVALASNYSWSFTITDSDPCPCSLKNNVNPAGASTIDDAGGYELGIKLKASANGYITALRFYKPIISTETTHTGHVWSSTGTNLATISFTNETDYGWQEAKLSTPLQVTEGQLYVISYGTTTAVLMRTLNALTSNMTSGPLTAYADNSPENAASLSGNRNGVFSTTAGNYPDSGGPSYFWVDAVFSSTATPDNPPEVKLAQPQADSYGAARDKPIKATFNHALNSGTVTGSTVRLFDSSNAQVGGTASYETTTHSVVFTPSSNLSYGQKYTVKLAATIEDTDGAMLGSEYTWSFTVGSQLIANPADGPGGPILVVTSTANKYSPYYAEILRTEGLNYFDTKDISTINSTTLANYDAVVLAEMTLSQSQTDMFSNWVTGGGNLLAMRPDKKLASLLGLTDASSTRLNQYMLVNTAAAPGTGIVNQTIQYKTTADNYTLNGASSIATLYSDASTSTTNPAVTTRSVGTQGGTAAAFTFDLAKSVIALHQGNQAWAGQERDGIGPKRSNDMFFGAKAGDVQPDWVDLNKVHIPQADEQQRLMANILTEATKDKRPLPRFWYLPHNYTAAMVLAGDDHNLNNVDGTERVFNNWLNESPTWCSVENWECVRASDYNYLTSSFTAARALQYYNAGFDIGDHPQNGCTDFTSYSSLGTIFSADLNLWRGKYSGIPNQRTVRYHCYLWSDWDSMARVELDNGMRYSLDYVTYPSSWLGTRAAIITGSGMNMRFTDADGDMLDIRQGVTNFENSVATVGVINGVLDNATGSNGYYGLFGTHYDMGDSYHTTLFARAQAYGIPIISADQALTWLDGHGSSSFSNMAGTRGRFTFDINPAVGANGLRAMMPLQDAGGSLSSITFENSAVTTQTQTIKGVQYAVFDAKPGSYTVLYDDYDPNPPPTPGSGGSNSGNTESTTPSSGSGSALSGDDTNPSEEGTSSQNPPKDEDETSTNDADPTKTKKAVSDSNTSNMNWLIWLIAGILLLIGALIFLLARRRKRRETDQHMDFLD